MEQNQNKSEILRRVLALAKRYYRESKEAKEQQELEKNNPLDYA